jgi:hypothetical protein
MERRGELFLVEKDTNYCPVVGTYVHVYYYQMVIKRFF